MARRELDGKASREKELGTQEETGSMEEKAVKVARKVSREPPKSKRHKNSKRITTSASNGALAKKGKRPSQETTENKSIESNKQQTTPKGKHLGKKPSTERTDNIKSNQRKKFQSCLDNIGEEVTPPGISHTELKEAEKKQKSVHGQSTTFSSKQQKEQRDSTTSLKTFHSIEDQITKLPYFHGFVCREDLNVLLRKPGDWLIRISVMPHEPKKKEEKEEKEPKNATTSKEPSSMRRNHKFFVVSVLCKEAKDPKPIISPGTTKSTSCSFPVRNLVIRHADGKLVLDTGKMFKTVAELIAFYQRNVGNFRGADFQLVNPIPLSLWEFQHEDVELLEKKLGEGAFGDVRVGRLKTKDHKKTLEVAVKMLKNAESVSRDQVAELLHEARVMRILDHHNVLRTFGIAVLKEPLYLMSEWCTFGALREYLKENRKTITLLDKLNFVLGSARGVEYLHSQRIIHRDLAVRNILLTDDRTPKVSDFGLAKLTDRYEMLEQCKIPIRYLAPETLELFIFTPKTDVFSFGCVIWEIYADGHQPHDGKNGQTIKDMSKRNHFLRLPQMAPEDLQTLVKQRVFVSDPENRCSMSAIVQCAERVEQSMKK